MELVLISYYVGINQKLPISTKIALQSICSANILHVAERFLNITGWVPLINKLFRESSFSMK